MNKQYAVGDIVKVIQSDESYDYSLGNQLHRKGTVSKDSASSGVYVKFFGNDEDWYYYQSEIELVRGVNDLPANAKFKLGDKVRFTDNRSTGFYGQEGIVTGYNKSGLVLYRVTKPADHHNRYMNKVGDIPQMNQRNLELVVELTKAQQVLAEAGLKAGDTVLVTKGSNKGRTARVIGGSTGGTYIRAVVGSNAESNYGLFYPDEVEKHTPVTIKKGDWVLVKDYAPGAGVFEGWEGEVTDIGYGHTTVKFTGKRYDTGTFANKFVIPAVKPKNLFNVGDWVKVVGRSDKHDGTVGTVQKVNTTDFSRAVLYTIHKDNVGDDTTKFISDNVLSFFEYQLEETAAPKEPKFRKGDWVQVKGYDNSGSTAWEGRKGQIEYEANLDSSTYVVDFTPSDDGGYASGGFDETTLVAATAPEPKPEPHWTETTPVGQVAQLTYEGGANRILVRQNLDGWLHLYQSRETGLNSTGTVRSNEHTKQLLGHEAPRFYKVTNFS